MRTVGALALLLAAGTAVAATAQEVVRVPRPPLPPPLATADGPGPARLQLVSARYHSPADLGPDRPDPPAAAPAGSGEPRSTSPSARGAVSSSCTAGATS